MKTTALILFIVIALSFVGGYAFALSEDDIEQMQNLAIDPELTFATHSQITFGDELMTINVDNGEIHWRGRLVATDKELVACLNDIIFQFKCRKCGEDLDAKP